jgi:membrane-bound lytic murein transglycosylase F
MSFRCDPRGIILILLLLGVFAGGEYLLHRHGALQALDAVREQEDERVLRVLAPGFDAVQSSLSPYGPGLEQELLEAFARGSGYRLQWLAPCDLAEAWQALEQGEADLLIGQGIFDRPHGKIQAGPAYAHYRPVLVQAPQGNGRGAGTGHVLLPRNPVLERHLPSLLPDIQPAAMTRVSPRFGVSAMLNSLDANAAPLALLPDSRFRLFNPFHLDLTPARTLPEEIPYRWFWRTDREHFAEAMRTFWNYHSTETRLAELTERYYGFLPAETPYYELRALYQVITEELPKFSHLIAEHTSKKGVDPLLLSALIYQESRFDPDARSRTGAKGLMQFTSVAARHFELKDPFDPDDSIRAACDYLNMVHKRLEPLDLKPWDKIFLTLAAYNQGPGHLSDAIALANRLGLEGRTWRELKKVFPLLEQKRHGKLAVYGTCRGSEGVRFVDRVRYYYYILYGIVRLSRPEAQHLGPLFDSLSGNSFAGGVIVPAPRPIS